jgi:hypothetical protein
MTPLVKDQSSKLDATRLSLAQGSLVMPSDDHVRVNREDAHALMPDR